MAMSSVLSSDAHEKVHFPFLRLPHEIRTLIYNRLFYTNDGFYATDGRGIYLCTQLLRVNRQIHAEAMEVMLKNCTFVLVELYDMVEGVESLDTHVSELDTSHWLSPAPYHLVSDPETEAFPGEHFKHYSMVIKLTASQYRSQGLAYDRIMLIGKANFTKFARQMARGMEWFEEFLDMEIAIQFFPLFSEGKQRKLETELLEALKAYLWCLPSVKIEGAASSEHAQATAATMMAERWSSHAERTTELTSILNDVKSAISREDFGRALNECIRGDRFTSNWLEPRNGDQDALTTDIDMHEYEHLIRYYWSKVKMVRACSLTSKSFQLRKHASNLAEEAAEAALTAAIAVLQEYDGHPIVEDEPVATDRSEGTWQLPTDAECAELLYELYNAFCITGQASEASRRLCEAIEWNEEDFRVDTAEAMLEEESFKLVPITAGSVVIWEPNEESPIMVNFEDTPTTSEAEYPLEDYCSILTFGS